MEQRLVGGSPERWYFYEARPGHWQWDVVADDGQVIAHSERAFTSRSACVLDAKTRGYFRSSSS